MGRSWIRLNTMSECEGMEVSAENSEYTCENSEISNENLRLTNENTELTNENSELTNENSELTGETDEKEERGERIIQLPITRVKHIIKQDPDVNLASQDAVILIAKAAELFIGDLAKESCSITTQSKRKTVMRKDMDSAVDRIDEFAFLEGAV